MGVNLDLSQTAIGMKQIKSEAYFEISLHGHERDAEARVSAYLQKEAVGAQPEREGSRGYGARVAGADLQVQQGNSAGRYNDSSQQAATGRLEQVGVGAQRMELEADITAILERVRSGERNAADALLPVVYRDLRQLAASYLRSERPDHTLQATELVHEAYLRLVDQRKTDW